MYVYCPVNEGSQCERKCKKTKRWGFFDNMTNHNNVGQKFLSKFVTSDGRF